MVQYSTKSQHVLTLLPLEVFFATKIQNGGRRSFRRPKYLRCFNLILPGLAIKIEFEPRQKDASCMEFGNGNEESL